MQAAERVFKEDLKIGPSDFISKAVQLPIMSLLDMTKLMDNGVDKAFITQGDEPSDIREKRFALIKQIENQDILKRVERILRFDLTAIVTEFFATSDTIKFLRLRTRLDKSNERDIGFVYRADQFVEFLINIDEQIADRDPLEVIGSIVRRKSRVYVFPCTYQQILSRETRYKTKLTEFFSDRFIAECLLHPLHLVTLDTLQAELSTKLRPLIEYMRVEKSISGIDCSDIAYAHMQAT